MRDEAEYLVERLHTAFAEDARVNQLGIVVTVVGLKVFLRGSVASEVRRESVTTVAREILPDHDIYNECTVEPAAPPNGPEVLS